MISKKDTTVRESLSRGSFVDVYNLHRDDIGVVRASIDGRFPEEGANLNQECDLVYYVLSGHAVIRHGDDTFRITPGDVLLLEKGKPYWMTAKELEIVEYATPAWNAEQYQNIKE